jgi:hypothetical protein
MTLLDLSPADFSRFITILVDIRLLGSQCCLSTGLVANGRSAWCLAQRGWNVRTWRKSHWSDESRFLLHVSDGRMRVWRHIVGLRVFSHQSADYSIVVAHLTSNSFEGHPCCMYADYLPSLCF